MLEVRRNEIALRKLCGGTAQLHTLEGTLLMVNAEQWGATIKWERCQLGIG